MTNDRGRLRTAARRGGALTVAATVVLAAAACSGSGEPTEEESVGGPAQLSVFAPQGPEQDLATNVFTQQLSEQFDIEFSWQTTTWDGVPAAEKRNIALASGDYPDLFLLIPWVDQFRPADVMRLGQQGVALPLNDLIREHAPNIQAALDSSADLRAMSTAPDGNIYGLPQLVECYHCSYQAKLWMNSEWLEELGLDQPTTTEEMREVLRAFKTRDPNGNGEADEVPLSASVRDDLIPYFMNSFIYDPQGTSGNNRSTLVLNQGRVDLQANKEGWREGLRYIKSLWDEDLIDPGAFTQNPDALQQIGDNSEAVILGSATVLHPAIAVTLGQEDGRDKDYDPVPPLTGPTGAAYAAYNFPSVPGATFVLTNKASANDQVAAIKMLDYIYTTQGQTEGIHGEKGVDWTDPEEGDIALDPAVEPLYKVLPAEDEGTPRNSKWEALAQYNNTLAYRNAMVVPEDIYDPAGYERRLFEATQLYAGKEDKAQVFPSWGIWVDPADATEMAQLQTNIENYVTQNSLAFITGSKDLDADWDAYVQGFEGLQLGRYLELQQAAYDQYLTR
ncbi:extracellular solute-binding protein [Auraticoccus sp. F435]|uniref:Extracellular solute-binding protein n=1 Tax=Auraticoccus cholistanensis TaxID=2656650 RepID=A0A6A9UWZ3_9ACTN|nr:extracellular solute-binding protein [Auraticoccus cholistanensis]MVA77248.1 extracellular solute-binding protein [Auraticoccus cholistanensis]